MTALHDERDELAARIEALTMLKTSLELAYAHADDAARHSLELAIDDASDKLDALEDEMFEIESELGFAEWREERRDTPIW